MQARQLSELAAQIEVGADACQEGGHLRQHIVQIVHDRREGGGGRDAADAVGGVRRR